MDFSQLPKMSSTPTTTKGDESSPSNATEVPSPEPRALPRDEHRERRDFPVYDTSFGSMWLSLISGIILLAMGQTFGRFLAAKLSGREFSTGWLQPDGVTPVKYFELQGGTAWSDMGLFLMGVALLLDAVVLGILAARGRPSRALLFVTVVLTSIAMVINVGVIFYLFGIDIFPLPSLIAVAVGGFVVFDHLPLLRRQTV